MRPYRARWGILATGWIAKKFAKDVVLDPATRDFRDVEHVVTAVGSSSSKQSAENFIEEVVTSKQKDPACSAYGSYAELVQDPNVDIIYVATPHSHHFQHVMQALNAGKPVLCEKPLTVNAHQAKALFAKAQEKGLFLMEAVWTRFFPLSTVVRSHIADGKIGEVLRGSADLSHILQGGEWDVSHRLISKDLAGGCLMDLGPYPFLWILQTMWHTLSKPHQKEKPRVAGTSMTKDTRTGVDIMTSVLLEMPCSTPKGEFKAHAIATSGFNVTYDPDGMNTAGAAVRLYGTKGELQVFGPIYRPERYRLLLHSGQIIEEKFKIPAGGWGMFWEADEAARCLRDQKLESDIIPWNESILVMELFDEARKLGGLVYPEKIESLHL